MRPMDITKLFWVSHNFLTAQISASVSLSTKRNENISSKLYEENAEGLGTDQNQKSVFWWFSSHLTVLSAGRRAETSGGEETTLWGCIPRQHERFLSVSSNAYSFSPTTVIT